MVTLDTQKESIIAQLVKNFVYNNRTQISINQDEFITYLRSRVPYCDIVLPLAGILVFILFVYLVHSQKRSYMIQNLMTEEEFHDKHHTIQAVSELMKTKEYQDFRRRKGNDVKNWNWQARARLNSDGSLKWTEPSVENEVN